MPGQLPSPKLKPTNRARLGLVCTVYHQQPGNEPISAESRFSRWLESEEQPYLRKLVIGEEWTLLDCGWLEDVGMLLLRNEEGKFQVQPTEAERAEVMSRVVEVAT